MKATNAVVVGTDGSSASRAALEYALQEAARRGARLRVVAVAQGSENFQGLYGFAPLPSSEEITEEVRAVAQQQLDEVRSAYPELAVVPVTVEARIGPPGPVLAAAAEGAVLLVLGRRGRGARRSTLLGSVGLYCVLYATCLVNVVPQARPAEPASTPEAAVAVSRA